MSTYYKIKKDGTRSWFYYFVYHGKKYRGVGGTTRTQATRVMDKVRAELIDGTFDVSLHNKAIPTLNSFITEYLDIRKHLKSAWREKIIAAHILSYFGKTIRLDLLKTKDVENFKLHRKSLGISNGTINRELGCFKRMFNLAIKWGDARNNPVINVDFFKIPQSPGTFLSLEEASTN